MRALAAGALLAQAAAAVFTDPLGDVDLVRKFAHNAILALGVAGLVTAGGFALHRSRVSARPAQAATSECEPSGAAGAADGTVQP